MGQDHLEARIDTLSFAEEQIICHHDNRDRPAGHWVRNV
jgi:hypothetical protein